jgi:hypothetical protein
VATRAFTFAPFSFLATNSLALGLHLTSCGPIRVTHHRCQAISLAEKTQSQLIERIDTYEQLASDIAAATAPVLVR